MLSGGTSAYDNLSEEMSEQLLAATHASIEGLRVFFGARSPSAGPLVTTAQKAVHEQTINKVMRKRASLPARIEAALDREAVCHLSGRSEEARSTAMLASGFEFLIDPVGLIRCRQ